MNEIELVSQSIQSIKICLLGNSGVGKSCIAHRYTDENFDENQFSSEAAQCYSKVININGQKLYLDIWDTAGQEKYRSLGRYFYKESYIIILVYDIGNQKSFNDLKNEWYNNVQQYGEQHTILGVVGNKSDLYKDNGVPEKKVRKFAKDINAEFMVVSAKTGHNINLLFENLVRKYLDKDFQNKLKENERNNRQNFILNNNKEDQSSCCSKN